MKRRDCSVCGRRWGECQHGIDPGVRPLSPYALALRDRNESARTALVEKGSASAGGRRATTSGCTVRYRMMGTLDRLVAIQTLRRRYTVPQFRRLLARAERGGYLVPSVSWRKMRAYDRATWLLHWQRTGMKLTLLVCLSLTALVGCRPAAVESFPIGKRETCPAGWTFLYTDHVTHALVCRRGVVDSTMQTRR